MKMYASELLTSAAIEVEAAFFLRSSSHCRGGKRRVDRVIAR
jgi:hypothetical protein